MYTREELEKLADLGILPSKLGVFGKCDEKEVEMVEIDEEVFEAVMVCAN